MVGTVQVPAEHMEEATTVCLLLSSNVNIYDTTPADGPEKVTISADLDAVPVVVGTVAVFKTAASDAIG